MFLTEKTSTVRENSHLLMAVSVREDFSVENFLRVEVNGSCKKEQTLLTKQLIEHPWIAYRRHIWIDRQGTIVLCS